MTNILIGLGTSLVFFVALISSFYAGYKVGSKTKPIIPILTEEQQRKAKKMAQGWQNILNYDAGVARGDK
jgi:hypothetical protein